MKKINLVIAAFAVVLSNACDTKPVETKIDSFPVTTILAIDTFTYSDYVTEIQAQQNVEIRARVSGYLEKIYVDEGTIVQSNQLLFSINPREYIEEAAKAKALYKSAVSDAKAAELELKNVQALAEKNIVSQTEIALAKNKYEAQNAKMEEAQAHLSFAQIKLSYTEIRAPFKGAINRIPHKVGSLIEAGTLLTAISASEEIFAYFNVSEKEYLSYARSIQKDSNQGKTVNLILADGTPHQYPGKIETIESVIDANTGNIAFRARFKNSEHLIKHGASGIIRWQNKSKKVLVVPQKSTFELQDKVYVYVVDTNNKVQQRNIQISDRLPHLFIINNGLKEGERIIYEGLQNVKSDMRIAPQEKNMRQIINTLVNK